MLSFRDPIRRGAIPTKQVAQLLGCHEESVRRWIRGGQLKAIRWGRGPTYDIRPRDLDAFVKARET
jgi:excisionase family DNA binding protein